uniref:TFIIS N-terminal domain-containing protein n=1 Tax=Oryzias latipes TaxID=8090 RepID=A0A3P9LGJ3_ORYLA
MNAESAVVVVPNRDYHISSRYICQLTKCTNTNQNVQETGIGKTVNSFRRHKQAGEVAKALVKGWKNLVPKEFTSRQFGLNSRSKSMPSKHSSTEEESSPAPGKSSKTIKATTDEGSSGKSQSSEAQHRKRKKSEEKLNISKSKHADNRELSKQQKKKPKMNHKNEESNSDKCLMSFESCLNYDVNDFKRKEKSGIKRAPKKPKSTTKRQAEDSEMKPEKSPTVSPKQVPQTLITKGSFVLIASVLKCLNDFNYR